MLNRVTPEPAGTADVVRNEVSQFHQKNMIDELVIVGLRELVINVKEQLDKTMDGNPSNVTRPVADNSEHLSKECEMIKSSVEGSARLIRPLISTTVTRSAIKRMLRKLSGIPNLVMITY